MDAKILFQIFQLLVYAALVIINIILAIQSSRRGDKRGIRLHILLVILWLACAVLPLVLYS